MLRSLSLCYVGLIILGSFLVSSPEQVQPAPELQRKVQEQKEERSVTDSLKSAQFWILWYDE